MFEKDKKICPECGKIHENNDFDELAEEFTDSIFPQIWKQGKKDLKGMSKKEVAEQMYFLGVKHFMEQIHNNLKNIEDNFKK